MTIKTSDPCCTWEINQMYYWRAVQANCNSYHRAIAVVNYYKAAPVVRLEYKSELEVKNECLGVFK